MAATPTWDDVRKLAEYRAQKGRAISLYVDLDPARSPTPRDASTRVNSLLADGHKDALRRDQSHEEKEALKRDFERLERYFEHEFERDGARGLAVFCAGLDGMWIDPPGAFCREPYLPDVFFAFTNYGVSVGLQSVGAMRERVERLNAFFETYRSGDEYDTDAITHVMACSSWYPGEMI